MLLRQAAPGRASRAIIWLARARCRTGRDRFPSPAARCDATHEHHAGYAHAPRPSRTHASRGPHSRRARRETTHGAGYLPAVAERADRGLQPENRARAGDERQRGRSHDRARRAEAPEPRDGGQQQPRAAFRAQHEPRARHPEPGDRAADDPAAARPADGRRAAPEQRTPARLRGHLVGRGVPGRTRGARSRSSSGCRVRRVRARTAGCT